MGKENAPEREQTTIRLPRELKEKLQKESDRKGMDFNSFLLSVFHLYLESL